MQEKYPNRTGRTYSSQGKEKQVRHYASLGAPTKAFPFGGGLRLRSYEVKKGAISSRREL